MNRPGDDGAGDSWGLHAFGGCQAGCAWCSLDASSPADGDASLADELDASARAPLDASRPAGERA